MAQESCNLDKEEAEVLKPPSSPPRPPTPSSSSPPPPPASSPPSPSLTLCLNQPIEITADQPDAPISKLAVDESQPSVRLINRCSCCSKKVGLTGFRCRCGELFCSRHRYSETHDCSYDYKAAGREAISKANPVVRASKIIKI